jgi:hypothetical protein
MATGSSHREITTLRTSKALTTAAAKAWILRSTVEERTESPVKVRKRGLQALGWHLGEPVKLLFRGGQVATLLGPSRRSACQPEGPLTLLKGRVVNGSARPGRAAGESRLWFREVQPIFSAFEHRTHVRTASGRN